MRGRKNPNKSNYHYVAHYYEGDEIVEEQYFLTIKHIQEKHPCCRKTLMKQIANPDRRSHLIKDVKFYRVSVPVSIQVLNPEVSG
jgi:hypothetical protein